MDDLAYTHIKPTIASTKITATPTATMWAQAYHAGHLFAVLSLSQKEESTEEEKTLGALGKEIINTLEEEYFTLETKTLSSIKQALQTTCAKIPSDVDVCFLVSAIIANPKAVEAKQKEILYLFAIGKGAIALKRDDTIHSLLHNTTELTAASGFLQDNDVIILQSESFSQVIPREKLLETLSTHPISDASEMLAPIIHEADNGTACAIFISYKSNLSSPSDKQPLVDDVSITSSEHPADVSTQKEERTPKKQRMSVTFNKLLAFILYLNLKSISPAHIKLSPKKTIFIIVAVALALLLIGSIIVTIQKKQRAQTVQLFQSIYPEAQKKFDEGQSLVDLNTNLAHESFLAAEKILKDGKTKFPDGSTEQEQINELLAKTKDALKNSSNSSTTKATAVDAKSSQLLEALIKNSEALSAAEDDKNVYLLSRDAITSLDRKNGKTKTLIENDSTWSSPGGLGVYLGSLYVLDKKANKIIKFPVTNEGFGETNYFASGTTPDVSQATGMAIDGSIFVLSKNGTITKFTKGTADDFKITNLDKGLLNPAGIFTTIDGDKLYILDNGHARVVILNKSGAYQAQYQVPQAKTAKALAVDEKNKKIYLLSGGKVFEASME